MNPLLFVYNEILFRPLFNLLVGITNVLPNHSVAIAIIAVTFLVRLLLLPATLHQARHMQSNQVKMAALKDQLKKIKEQYKGDKGKHAQATMELYRKAGINPVGGCLPLLVQLPILIALYRVFLTGIKPETWQYLYSFVAQPTAINFHIGSLDLSQPSLMLGVVAGIAQFVQMRLFTPTPAPTAGLDDSAKAMETMQKNMTYIFPVMTIFIAWKLPAALALYWLVSTLFGIAQQYLVKRTMNVSLNLPVT